MERQTGFIQRDHWAGYVITVITSAGQVGNAPHGSEG